uniref:DUF3398 domain-containing protein n=1 Tax=Panagrellus redivivus TaxID=6233 RepID=A0A7E4W8J4_PANRE
MDGLPPPRFPLPKSPSQLPAVREESDAEDDESDACRSASPLEGEDSISWGSYDSDARPTKVKFKMSSYDSLDKLVMPTHSILKVKTTRPFADVANFEDISTNQHLRHDIDVLQHKMLRGHHPTDFMSHSPFTYVPDQVVVQLYVFDAEHHGGMWHEAGRYIKYEESVEGIDTMWSRPHVPFLPFLNVMILRKLLESGE